MPRNAKISIRPVKTEDDIRWIMDLAQRERLSFDSSGLETRLETLEDLRANPNSFHAWIGLVGPVAAGFMLVAFKVPHPRLTGKTCTLVYATVIEKELRGTQLFRLFDELAKEEWKQSGDYSLHAYCLSTNRMLKSLHRWGWNAKVVELQFVPEVAESAYEGPSVMVAQPKTSRVEEFESPALGHETIVADDLLAI